MLYGEGKSHVGQTAYRVGNIVIASVAGSLDTSIAAFKTLAIHTGLPKPYAYTSTSLACQNTADARCLLSIGTNGTLSIESKGPAISGWVFGCLVYPVAV